MPCTTSSTERVPPAVPSANNRSCRADSSPAPAASAACPAALSPSNPGVERVSTSSSRKPSPTASTSATCWGASPSVFAMGRP